MTHNDFYKDPLYFGFPEVSDVGATTLNLKTCPDFPTLPQKLQPICVSYM